MILVHTIPLQLTRNGMKGRHQREVSEKPATSESMTPQRLSRVPTFAPIRDKSRFHWLFKQIHKHIWVARSFLNKGARGKGIVNVFIFKEHILELMICNYCFEDNKIACGGDYVHRYCFLGEYVKTTIRVYLFWKRALAPEITRSLWIISEENTQTTRFFKCILAFIYIFPFYIRLKCCMRFCLYKSHGSPIA